MSGSPKQKLDEQAGEETTTEDKELYLRDGRKLIVRDQLVEIRSESGMVEVRIELTEKGPVLRMESVRMHIAASEAVEIAAPRVAIAGEDKLELSGGHVEVEGEQEVTVDAKGDVHVKGKTIFLN
jgi:hypothetical protein